MIAVARHCGAIFFTILLSFSVQADWETKSLKTNSQVQWQIDPLIKSLKGSRYDIDVLTEGLASVQRITFKDRTVNRFEPNLNRFVLEKEVSDGAQRLKPLSELSSQSLGLLAHEAFHAYKENRMPTAPRFAAVKDMVRIRGIQNFPDLSADKAEVAIEEAYGVFIGYLFSTDAFLSFALERMQKESADCERTFTFINQIWAATWNQNINGYYYNDGYFEYWGEKIKGLWDRIHGAGGGDQEIYTQKPLSSFDKKWIASILLQGKFKQKASEQFADQFHAMNCDQTATAQ